MLENHPRETAVTGPAVQVPDMNLDIRDYTLRGLILLAGALSALLLTMQGWGPAVPAIAIGGAVGAMCASKLESVE